MENESNFDLFELIVAILLGLAAISTSWAGYQGGLWGGNMATAYGEAATKSIKAATQQTDAIIKISNDYQIDIKAKSELSVGHYASRADERARAFENADYLYRWQMSTAAYESLGLPLEKHAENLKDEQEFEDFKLTQAELKLAWDNELDDEGNTYDEDQLEESGKLFKEADATFIKGKEYNATGDKFELVGVIFTISLFFAGLALVFKSSVKWGFFGVGSIIYLVGLFYMISLPML